MRDTLAKSEYAFRPFACQPHKPPHRRTTSVSARCGIILALMPDEQSGGAGRRSAIDAGTMVRILFENEKITTGGCAALPKRIRMSATNLLAIIK